MTYTVIGLMDTEAIRLAQLGIDIRKHRHFQGAVWQRCQVHFVRNALSLCGVAQRPLVLSLMRSVTEAATREAARTALAAAVAELEKKSPKVASVWRQPIFPAREV